MWCIFSSSKWMGKAVLPLLCPSTEQQVDGKGSDTTPVPLNRSSVWHIFCSTCSLQDLFLQYAGSWISFLVLLAEKLPLLSSTKNSIPRKKWQAHGTLHYQQQNHDNQQQQLQHTLKWTSTVNAHINTQTIHTQPSTTLITRRQTPHINNKRRYSTETH